MEATPFYTSPSPLHRTPYPDAQRTQQHPYLAQIPSKNRRDSKGSAQPKKDMSFRKPGDQDRRHPRLIKSADSNQLTLAPKESES
jgi:hypothetical protein